MIVIIMIMITMMMKIQLYLPYLVMGGGELELFETTNIITINPWHLD